MPTTTDTEQWEPAAVPVVGMDGRLHYARPGEPKCLCGIPVQSRKDRDIRHALANAPAWCNEPECMEYSY